MRSRAGIVVTIVGALALAAMGSSPLTAQITGDEDAERELLAYVPTEHRYRCVSSELLGQHLVAESDSVLASLDCGSSSAYPRFISYYLFSDADAMTRAHSSWAALRSSAADIDGCPSDTSWSFDDEDESGRLACLFANVGADGTTLPDTVIRIWTADDALVFGYAAAEIGNTDAATLEEWWNESAGPTHSPDTTGLARPSYRRDAGAERALLRAIPKKTRRSCEIHDRSDPTESSSLYEVRYFVSAMTVCDGPGRGVSTVWYARIDPEIIEDFADQVYGLSPASLDEVSDEETCPQQSTYSIGTGKNKRTAGTYACYYLDDEDGTESVVWRWTDTEQGFFGVAVNESGDADALETWWSSSNSGPTR